VDEVAYPSLRVGNKVGNKKETLVSMKECQELNPLTGDELVSSLHRNSDTRTDAALASAADTSGHPDKVPVLAQHAESEAFSLDRERFTQARHSCLEPDRSVGKVPVGELSLSSKEECLSLPGEDSTSVQGTQESVFRQVKCY
jgi:hypothetical protein